jgi:hypothetical protein
MATLFLKRVGFYLVPDGDESVSALSSLPFGKSLKAEVKQPRNPAFHRLYFALCKRIADGVGRDAEEISTVFKFATGHVDQIHSKTYGYIKIPKSISFAKLDETAFREFFNACVAVALDEWGIEPEALSDLIDPKTEIRPAHSPRQVA